MLCQSCKEAIKLACASNPNNAVVLHPSLESFTASVRQLCYICCRIHASLFDRDWLHLSNSQFLDQFPDGEIYMFSYPSFSFEESTWDANVGIAKAKQEDKFIGFHLIPKGDATEASLVKPGLNISGDSTAMATKIWKRWFETCTTSHSKCRGLENQARPFIPERLIEILCTETLESSRWRLVSSHHLGHVSYVTLSHCWGSSDHLKLLKSNLDHLQSQEGIPPTTLPKTYQDAFVVALDLGFRFIWVDSLCIIQDDDGDWKEQSSVMGMIYKYGQCNLAAAWAQDGKDGCFSYRDPEVVEPPLVELTSAGDKLTRSHVIVDSLVYYNDLHHAPLNTRGWVVQERYMARRQLSFCKQQVYWECEELLASEQFPCGIPETLTNLTHINQWDLPGVKPSLNFKEESSLRDAWTALVEQYSGCQLTRSSDKVIALAGLAGEFRSSLGDIYLAGMWRTDLIRQICWSANEDSQGMLNRLRDSTYMAPTWSWMSVTGPVQYCTSYSRPNSTLASFSKVLEVSVESNHHLSLHSFVSSKLVISGLGLFGRALFSPHQISRITKPDFINWPADLEDVGSVSLTWDENLLSEDVDPVRWKTMNKERSSTLLFLAIERINGSVSGLILRKSQATDTYTRMGYFSGAAGLGRLIARRLSIDYLKLLEGGELNPNHPGLGDIIHIVSVI
ncbi:hypothetical protein V2G26_012738 [Clonostachys chloroleuca]